MPALPAEVKENEPNKEEQPKMRRAWSSLRDWMIGAVERGGAGRRLPRGILVDSGAPVSVADGDEFPEFPREPSAGSIRGQHFLGAGSGRARIPNLGQKKVSLVTDDRVKSKLTLQDAKVRRPILAVNDSVKANTLVVFDLEESAIIPRDSEAGRKILAAAKSTAHKVKLQRSDGVWEIPARVDAPMESTTKTVALFQRPGPKA